MINAAAPEERVAEEAEHRQGFCDTAVVAGHAQDDHGERQQSQCAGSM